MKKFIFILCLSSLLISQKLHSQLDVVWTKTIPNLGQIGCVRFSHDSKMLLCQVPSQHTYIFDVQNGNLISDSLPNMSEPRFSNNDSFVYGFGGKKIAKYNIQSAIDESLFVQADTSITSMAISKDEKYYIGGHADGFSIWDIETGKIIRRKVFIKDSALDYSELSQIQLSCDNSKIYLLEYRRYLTGKDDKGNPTYTKTQRINVYDFNSLDSIGCISSWKTGDTVGFLSDFLISSTCQIVALEYTGQVTSPIKLFDLTTMKLKSSISMEGIVKFSSDDKFLVTATNGSNPLAIWDINIGKQLNNKYPDGSVQNLDLSNDIKYIAISNGYLLHLLKFPTTEVIDNPKEIEVLYPNPTTGVLNLQINFPQSSILTATLIDISGRNFGEVYNKFTEQGNTNILLNLIPYPTGTYFISLTGLNYSKKFKIILNK